MSVVTRCSQVNSITFKKLIFLKERGKEKRENQVPTVTVRWILIVNKRILIVFLFGSIGCASQPQTEKKRRRKRANTFDEESIAVLQSVIQWYQRLYVYIIVIPQFFFFFIFGQPVSTFQFELFESAWRDHSQVFSHCNTIGATFRALLRSI